MKLSIAATLILAADFLLGKTSVHAAPGDPIPNNVIGGLVNEYYASACHTDSPTNPTNCNNIINAWGPIDQWDTSLVTNMANLFSTKPNFNPDIGAWDTSRVTRMDNMFRSSSFNGDIGNWNTSQVMHMGSMFASSGFNRDISNWDTSKVTDMQSLFERCPFNSDISKWNVGRVWVFQTMFEGNQQFNQDISSWDTSSSISMSRMFNIAKKFNQNLSNWDTSKVMDMTALFGETPFNSDISTWDTSRVTVMTALFFSSPFNHDISNWDTSKVRGFSSMFEANTAFNQDISIWDISSGTAFHNMFRGATTFNQNLCAWKPYMFDERGDTTDYSNTYRVFQNSGCTYKTTPTSEASSFCAAEANCVPPDYSSAPSSDPSSQPSMNPTDSPGWEIEYNSMTVDFSASSAHEIDLWYNISSTRELEVALYKEDCSANIEEYVVGTSSTRDPASNGYDSLHLYHDINKTAVASSSIWDNITNHINVCQVVRLVEPANGSIDKMIISEEKQVLSIGFNLTADFSFTNDLQDAEAGVDSESTNLDDSIEACKCDNESNCNDDALSPNEELHVCVSSSSSDAGIKSITSMNINQGDVTTLRVVESGQVKYESFSSMEVAENFRYKVNVLLPINLFDFSGSNITVVGTLEMQLGGGSGGLRKLQIANGVANTEAAPFQLQIALTDAPKEVNNAKVAEEEEAGSTYVVPLLAAVGSVSLLAMAGMAMAFRARAARNNSIVG